MPYAPQHDSIAARLLASAGDKVADDLQNTFAEVAKAKQETDYLSGNVRAAFEGGLIDPADLEKFATGSLTQKRQIGSQAGALMADEVKRMQLDQGQQRINMDGWQLQEAQRHNAATEALANKPQFTPDPETLKAAKDAGYLVVPVSRGAVNLVPMKGKGVTAQPEPVTMEKDGVTFRKNAKGDWLPLPSQAPKPLTAREVSDLQFAQTSLAEQRGKLKEYTDNPDKGTGVMGMGNSRKADMAAIQKTITDYESQIDAIQSPPTRTKKAAPSKASSATAQANRDAEAALPTDDPLQAGGDGTVLPPIKGGETALSPVDQSALEWARKNPNDARAAKILQRLGVQ